MKKIYILITAVILGFGSFASEGDSLKTRPGQITFFYPLGTSGVDAINYSNNVSFNILCGMNGGLNGVEFGGLVNTNLGSVNGAQFAGIANINTKEANGIFFGGIRTL